MNLGRRQARSASVHCGLRMCTEAEVEVEEAGDAEADAEAALCAPAEAILAGAAAAVVSLDTTRVSARFSDLRRSFSDFSF